MSSSLADCLFACSLPQQLCLQVLGLPNEYLCPRAWQTACLHLLCPPKLFLEVLGLPKLSICVLVLGRLPICGFSAPEIVFRGAGLAEAEYLCLCPWQTAYLRFLCPQHCF